jgi:tetrahydromethanopterin S-methyltransferase subunit C
MFTNALLACFKLSLAPTEEQKRALQQDAKAAYISAAAACFNLE